MSRWRPRIAKEAHPESRGLRGGLNRVRDRLDPVALVLLVTAVFVWLTGKPAHALFVGTIGLLLTWKTIRGTPSPQRAREPEPKQHASSPASASFGASSSLAALTTTATLVIDDADCESEGETRRRTYHGALVAGVGMVFALVVAAFPRFSWPATVAVVAVAAYAVARGWDRQKNPADELSASDGQTSRAGLLAWALAFGAGALWELAALLQQPSLREGSYDHPTISILVDSLLAGYWGRAITLLLWLCLGWFLMREIER